MRRKDREITDFDEMMKIIAKCDTCRVAMYDETFPYIVPLNFGTDLEDDQLYLYFHGAKIGKKIDLMRKNKNVSFEMDCEHNIILYNERMSCTMGYESVIGYGEVEFLSEEEKMHGLKVLMRHYHEEDFKFNTKMIGAIEVFRIKVLSMTGKKRDNIHPVIIRKEQHRQSHKVHHLYHQLHH
ncbi:pyridoxamine 5'-phosphate oxidase family protein [Catenibacterium sp.]|uniref:pyridoxamine 5'-phosphate oxidase family protein n=1 Tax=Catenibacterium sp. TaxID=2049022 RepID=UPI002E7796CC|nr:pyridoxamine 5'-phosphate oxidase family protein [Catenibacterium sp.]MEE0819971.1 pyridoxamine 5'-phosphate oxidase family protein [Catenibacterium sp.]